ncbi:hypothetical protein H0R92_07190 [Treponema sp. OMZ 840]|uniref:hypothetical protein n=1 Tax=Treponema sp. OMZ 840 TaxID=244313 RepID=UPI003D8D21D3
MKIKRFFMLFASLSLCVCMLNAEQPAEQNQAPADEKNILFAEEVYGTFLMHYFETKDSRITDITVAYFNTQNEIKESMHTLLIGFYCELFKDSILKEAILEGIASLEKDSITDFFYRIAALDYEQVCNQAPVLPDTNDMYWASYFASGDEKYLDYIFQAALRFQDDLSTPELFLTGQTALWSLASNARQFDSVRTYIDSKRSVHKKTADYILYTDPEDIKTAIIRIIASQREKGLWP